MGWWSCTVMGGDDPLDWLSDLASVCGVGFVEGDDDEAWEQSFHGFMLTRGAVEAHLDALVQHLESIDARPYDNARIPVQVLGAMILWTGAAIPDALRERIIASAEGDEWAAENEERAHYIARFVVALRQHEAGKRTDIDSEGLWDALDRKTATEH